MTRARPGSRAQLLHTTSTPHTRTHAARIHRAKAPACARMRTRNLHARAQSPLACRARARHASSAGASRPPLSSQLTTCTTRLARAHLSYRTLSAHSAQAHSTGCAGPARPGRGPMSMTTQAPNATPSGPPRVSTRHSLQPQALPHEDSSPGHLQSSPARERHTPLPIPIAACYRRPFSCPNPTPCLRASTTITRPKSLLSTSPVPHVTPTLSDCVPRRPRRLPELRYDMSANDNDTSHDMTIDSDDEPLANMLPALIKATNATKKKPTSTDAHTCWRARWAAAARRDPSSST